MTMPMWRVPRCDGRTHGALAGSTQRQRPAAPRVLYRVPTSRCSLKWNQRHQSANLLVTNAGYGVTGSGTTMVGKFTSNLTGVLVAKALGPDAHPYPVNPGNAAQYLTEWPWRCSCGALAPQNTTRCLSCQQKGLSS